VLRTYRRRHGHARVAEEGEQLHLFALDLLHLARVRVIVRVRFRRLCSLVGLKSGLGIGLGVGAGVGWGLGLA